MNPHRLAARIAALLLALAPVALRPAPALAHCDGMDGPVVEAARRALASGDVNLALVWVQEQDEAEVRQAFARTLEARKLGDAALEVADTYFFETLVRLHRAGEGASYTGLKPAGRDLGPAIPLADQALTTGNLDPLVQLIATESRHGLIEAFERARKAKERSAVDIAAGREYVRTYVSFVHLVEGLHQAATRSPAGHFPEPAHSEGPHEH